MTDVSTTTRYSYADLPGLMAVMSGDEKHDMASESTLDVIWVLYDRVLRLSPATAAAGPGVPRPSAATKAQTSAARNRASSRRAEC